MGGEFCYEPIMKAKILHSDPGRVEFMYDGDLPPFLVGLAEKCGIMATRHQDFQD